MSISKRTFTVCQSGGRSGRNQAACALEWVFYGALPLVENYMLSFVRRLEYETVEKIGLLNGACSQDPTLGNRNNRDICEL